MHIVLAQQEVLFSYCSRTMGLNKVSDHVILIGIFSIVLSGFTFIFYEIIYNFPSVP